MKTRYLANHEKNIIILDFEGVHGTWILVGHKWLRLAVHGS